MKKELLLFLMEHFSSDKEFIENGYYRIRETNEGIQLAFLIDDACGATAVHPQITVVERDGWFVPVSLVDLGSTPTRFLSEEDGLLEELNFLVTKMLNIKELTWENN